MFGMNGISLKSTVGCVGNKGTVVLAQASYKLVHDPFPDKRDKREKI